MLTSSKEMELFITWLS